MPRYAVLVLFVTVGCSGAHTIDADAGTVPPDAPATTHACQVSLPPSTDTPTLAGEGCYCDGPFAVRGDFAYRQSFQLEVVDVSTPGAPRLVRAVPSMAVFANDVAIVGDVLFAAGGALERFDLGDPSTPISLGTTDLGGQVAAMGVVGHVVLVALTRADQSNVLVPIDASDPRALRVGSPLGTGNFAINAIVASGAIAFALGSDVTTSTPVGRVLSVDAHDIDAPRVVGSIDVAHSWFGSLAVHDTQLFVSGIEQGVRAIDATDPTAMRDLGEVLPSVPGAQVVDVTDDVLVVGGDGTRLFALPSLAPLGTTTVIGMHSVVRDDQLIGSTGNALFSIPLSCD